MVIMLIKALRKGFEGLEMELVEAQDIFGLLERGFCALGGGIGGAVALSLIAVRHENA